MFLYCIALGAREFLLVVERFDHVGEWRFAEWIVVFLKHISIVEMTILVKRHCGVVALKLLDEFWEKVFRLWILRVNAYAIEVYFFDFKFLCH